jgi:hypothetical protein
MPVIGMSLTVDQPFRRRFERADERTQTADLVSLRVIGQALQGYAGGCKCRIFRGVSFPCLAACCTILRSRWYQIGINRGIAASRSCSLVAYLKDVQHIARLTRIQPLLGRYSRWMPSVGRATANNMDKALG